MSCITLEEIVQSGTKLTPMMDQYYSIKKMYPDAFLLFRMGDFYEVFFEDAEKASKLLNITKTHRGKLGGHPIPMAGMPHHAAGNYIDRLTSQGYKVAICEQVQNPKDAIGIVKRAVTQVVSPGIPFDLEKTDAREQHFILSAHWDGTHYSLVALDFTTGLFTGQIIKEKNEFLEKLRSFEAKEFITFMGQWEDLPEVSMLLKNSETLITHLSEDYFNQKFTSVHTEKLIPSFSRDEIIKTNTEILSPIGALAYYICSTQSLEEFYHIRPFKILHDNGIMKVTLPTLQGLEILPRTRQSQKDSLLSFMNKTKTALGSRALKTFFLSPTSSREEILERQKVISFFIKNPESLQTTRDHLSEIRDLERILAKVSTGKATSSDLLNTSTSIEEYFQIATCLKKLDSSIIPTFDKSELSLLSEISLKIEQTLNREIGASLEKGNLIKTGVNKKRDQLERLTKNTSEELLKLEARYRKETGISKLRVKRNNVAGYFIEISKMQSNKVPKYFDRKQTLVNAERYLTPELAEFEKEMLTAQEKLERLEREIFRGVLESLSKNSALVLKLATIISHIDVYQSFAWVAIQEKFSCPKITKKGKITKLVGAWHPLIKAIINEQFTPHDLLLDEKNYFALITGPNMAGKTTVMREVAIIQLLAQVGSYVPATSAELSLCDYLFSRLGASDDILKGQSTFMVEMAETAEIVRHATDKSLIILDEIGRGTSTYDGLSIAWALVEHFVSKVKARTLFATHYHELIELVDKQVGAKNLTVDTHNDHGNIQFLYRLIEKGASQSYGIHVAQMAGLPADILYRSKEVLSQLEVQQKEAGKKEITLLEENNQLSFFDDTKEENKAPTILPLSPHLLKLEKDLQEMDIMQMTPLQAIQKLGELKDSLGQGDFLN